VALYNQTLHDSTELTQNHDLQVANFTGIWLNAFLTGLYNEKSTPFSAMQPFIRIF